MRILIVDDHPIFSLSLRLLLSELWEAAEITDCVDSDEAEQHCATIPFDLVLLDWKLKGSPLAGGTLIQKLKGLLPDAWLVVVSGEAESQVILEAIDAGANGFVPKEFSRQQIQDALMLVTHGGTFLPPAVLQSVRAGARIPGLTARHEDVLRKLATGMPNKQIARELGVSDSTVKQHLQNIFRTLNVGNRTEALSVLASKGVRF